jgi:transposase
MKGEQCMELSSLQQKRSMIDGMTIVGIDPAKAKHQAMVIDPIGSQLGKTFSFDVSHEGYTNTLWHKLRQIVPNCNPQSVAFAVETSCNLWLTLCAYLEGEGYRVLLVSPLTTHHARPMLNHDFSRTDPKDALIVASNAQHGYFDLYTTHPPLHAAMHRLSITYDKLRKGCSQNRARLRALMEQVFPEFLTIVEPDTHTAMYLLKRYLFPQDFLSLNVAKEAQAIAAISRNQYGLNSLLQLQRAAHHSIGVLKTNEECIAERISLTCWIALIETISSQMEQVLTELYRCAEQLPEYHILLSLKGISSTTAALFLAELQNIHRFSHFKQVEKKAGLNLRLSQSGQFVGTRHISHLGDNRLRWLLYSMTEETAKWIPEVRIKYLHRQLKSRKHRKSIIASTPQLLKLIMALVRENRLYETRPDTLTEMIALEQQYTELKEKQKKAKRQSFVAGQAA